MAISRFIGIKKKKSYEGAREFYEDETETKRITDTEKDTLVIDIKPGQTNRQSSTSHHHNPPAPPKHLRTKEIKVNTGPLEGLFDNIETDVLLETKPVVAEPKKSVITEDLLSNHLTPE